MTLHSDEVATLTGLPETVLPPEVAAQLPPHTPGAPWRVRMSSLIWWQPAEPSASEALPAPLKPKKGRGVTSAGFIQYAATPVGPYNEVMAMPVSAEGGLTGRVHIPFIAVDSLASVHAGRAHWALPKVMASFAWADDGSAVRAEGDGWWISARIMRTGAPVPLVGRSTVVQVRPDGRVGSAKLSMLGLGRIVTLDVDRDDNASFASWLTPGKHKGMTVRSAMLRMSTCHWGDG